VTTDRSTKSPRFFSTADAFREWRREHGSTERELIVGFCKVGSGRPSMTSPESVEAALSAQGQWMREAAWTCSERAAPSYRNAITHWISSAKRPETRARRPVELIDACSRKVRLLK
jgi:uncharacterized protein YdeI (YjbR/CyaY-like superfamily)